MNFQEVYKKAEPNGNIKKFVAMTFVISIIASVLVSGLIAGILLFNNKPVYYAGIIFVIIFLVSNLMLRYLPSMKLNSKKAYLESDLLYSVRHLLLKLESGSALLNSLESVSKLNTKSSSYFKQLLFDVEMGMPLEDAIEKATEYSPSKAYTKLLIEIKTSLKTGADLQTTLKNTLEDITKEHLIHIKEYGKKLNPMSMFYMIIGAILPSLGTAMLIVASSMMSIEISFGLLAFVLFLLMVFKIFFNVDSDFFR
jgi:Flp pilus assembly protein TadB